MALVLLSPPPVEPVTLSELKEFLRVDPADTSQDNLISSLGVSAREWAENYTQRKIVQQSWALFQDFFPGYIDLKLAGTRVSSPFVSGSNAVLVGIRYALVLPNPPVQLVTKFNYQNANGQVASMSAGTDYIVDVLSNPARLTPPFGQIWPVARVVVNAIEIDYTVGYANPVVLSTAGSPPNLTQVSAAAYIFQASDVGRPISIPAAGSAGGTLNTVIKAISSPPSGVATLRDAASTPVSAVTALLVNNPNAQPFHWYLFKDAIKMCVARWYEIRIADVAEIPKAAVRLLMPARDLRF
jgi:Phage gp6-like head-tail connector protein